MWYEFGWYMRLHATATENANVLDEGRKVQDRSPLNYSGSRILRRNWNPGETAFVQSNLARQHGIEDSPITLEETEGQTAFGMKYTATEAEALGIFYERRGKRTNRRRKRGSNQGIINTPYVEVENPTWG